MQNLLNLFNLHGSYFQDNENRLTANFLFLLSELRSTFLPDFLRLLKIEISNPAEVEVIMQPGATFESQRLIPDAVIKCSDQFCVLIEAKIGTNPLSPEQLNSYARHLAQSGAKQKRLVVITQIEEGLAFHKITRDFERGQLPTHSCHVLRWYKVLDLLRKCVGLALPEQITIAKAVLNGQRVDYNKRLVSLFLDEVEETMFQKVVVDSVRAGELADIRVTTQKAWFMDVALRHRVWFPDGTLEHGLKPTRWVAYYETADCNGHPSHISHVARNRIFWNRITFDDAAALPELEELFRERPLRDEIQSWFQRDRRKPFHVVLTDSPVRLQQPIPLNRSRRARALTKKIFPAEVFFNARTVDELFDTSDA